MLFVLLLLHDEEELAPFDEGEQLEEVGGLSVEEDGFNDAGDVFVESCLRKILFDCSKPFTEMELSVISIADRIKNTDQIEQKQTLFGNNAYIVAQCTYVVICKLDEF